jgi:hypothetical protein
LLTTSIVLIVLITWILLSPLGIISSGGLLCCRILLWIIFSITLLVTLIILLLLGIAAIITLLIRRICLRIILSISLLVPSIILLLLGIAATITLLVVLIVLLLLLGIAATITLLVVLIICLLGVSRWGRIILGRGLLRGSRKLASHGSLLRIEHLRCTCSITLSPKVGWRA